MKRKKVAMPKRPSIHYRVTWEIDIWGENCNDAARQALAIQRRTDSSATIFTVRRADAKAYVTVDAGASSG